MTNTYRVLGQSAPAAATDTDLYTVPAATQVVISSIIVCNQAGATRQFRVAIRPNGAALAVEHYIYFNVGVAATDTFAATLGITLDAGDVVTVRTNNTTVSFSIYGAEIT